MNDFQRAARRAPHDALRRSLAADEPATRHPVARTARRPEQSSRNSYGLSPAAILLLAMAICWVVLLIVGPVSIVDAMPDLDLGSGISMTPDGQIKVKNDPAPGPMRIPEESEYDGISMP